MKRFFAWLFGERKTVFLVKFDGKAVVARAYKTQSGYVARWIGNRDQWSILHPDGTVSGTTLVKKWLPRSGWEFNKDVEWIKQEGK